MRSFVRLSLLSLLAAFVAIPSLASAADKNGGQIEFSGVFGMPTGSYASSGASLSDVYSGGPGFGILGTLGVTRRFHVGLRYGTFSGSKDDSFTFGDLTLPGGSVPPGSGLFDMKRTLTTSEFSGVLQYRRAAGPKAQYFVEAGTGLMTWRDRAKLTASGADVLTLTGYQQNLMWSAGGGLSFRVARNFDLVCTGRWLQAMTDDGDVWASGDDPGFVQASLGLRYPNY